MQSLVIIKPSSSPWASPLNMVPKSSGGWRLWDYRVLNQATIPDRYPVSPHTRFLCYPRYDLIKGYHQIPVAPGDIPKTAIITPLGLFEFTRMPFGLRNQAFQRLMDETCRWLSFVFAYIDDLLVACFDEQEHLAHLEILFQRLQDNGLVVNPSKWKFGCAQKDSWAMTSMFLPPHP